MLVSSFATTLPSGLQVLSIPQPSLHRVHVAVFVRVGSRYETLAENGISHFLEHMIYRGTSSLPSAHATNLAFEELGASLYAATQTDYGVFSLTLPPESLDRASRLFSEVLCDPAFLDIEIEKGIVREEILEDMDENGRQIDADNLSRQLIYPSHPLGYTITGSASQISTFDDALLRRHHVSHYTSGNTVVAFAGPIESEKVFELALRDFGRVPRGERIAARPPTHTQKKPRLQVVDNASSQTELRVCLRAVRDRAPERPALDMLMRIIDDGMSSRLYHRICDAQGLCYNVSAGYDGYEDDGVIDLCAGVQHARAAEVTSELLAIIEELAKTGPAEEELVRARKRQRWDGIAMLDSAEELADFFGVDTLFGNKETLEERIQSLDHVSAKDVQSIARLVADPARLNVVAVGLLETDEKKRLTDVVKGWKGAGG